ncbi:MAG: M23 family metallopeptidase [Candidatus Carbobacillus sp.]|nr:M23 family metallopeptidase [Candidatus Carbobacillus sp.]
MSMTLLIETGEHGVWSVSSRATLWPEDALPEATKRSTSIRLVPLTNRLKSDNEHLSSVEGTVEGTGVGDDPALSQAVNERKAHLATWLPHSIHLRTSSKKDRKTQQTVQIAALTVAHRDIPRLQQRITPLAGTYVPTEDMLVDARQPSSEMEASSLGASMQAAVGTIWVDPALDFIWPVRSPFITSGFGPRWGSYHYGLDIVSRQNDLTIVAARSGQVILSERVASGYGNLIIMDHGDGLTTYYAHLKKRFVKEGDFVRAGTPIGMMGSVGNATGVHLHFEVREHDIPKDPRHYLHVPPEATDAPSRMAEGPS